jgi:hypothetical protein
MEAEKKLKYKNLSTEIQRMWNMKRFVIPVIIGTTGIVSKGLKYIWKQYQDNIQQILYNKTSVLGTSHIISKVLQFETCSLSGGVHHWLKRRRTREKKTCDKRTK